MVDFKPQTITFSVDGIGEFKAYRRTVARNNQISLLTDTFMSGVPEKVVITENTRIGIMAQAELMVLLASTPPGWSVDDDAEKGIDGALASDVYKVYVALRSAEDTFFGSLPKGTEAKSKEKQ